MKCSKGREAGYSTRWLSTQGTPVACRSHPSQALPAPTLLGGCRPDAEHPASHALCGALGQEVGKLLLQGRVLPRLVDEVGHKVRQLGGQQGVG